MELNTVIFPSPAPSYTYKDFAGKLIFIPRAPIVAGKSQYTAEPHFPAKDPKHIPCLYFPNYLGSSKVLLYFHGNAEDIGHTYDLMELLRDYLGVHVIAVEYPSYGIYAGSPSSNRIIDDATNVFDYLADICEWGEKNIILAGRSIGSGPSIHLASSKSPASILLISAYTSIRAAVKNVAGKMFQYFVKERFNNKSLMSKITCPVFLLHGIKDTLVPYSHAQELLAECKGVCFLSLPEEMDHCTLDYTADLCKPFKEFMVKCGIEVRAEKEPSLPKFMPELFILPAGYPKVSAPGMFKKFLLKFA